MFDARTARLLHSLIRRECTSLLQYVTDAFPWASGDEHAALDRVLHMRQEQTASIQDMYGLLRRHKASPPWIGPFPQDFTNVNFIAMDRLLDLLLEHQERELDGLKNDLEHIADYETRLIVEKLLERKLRHRDGLRQLTKERNGNLVAAGQ